MINKANHQLLYMHFTTGQKVDVPLLSLATVLCSSVKASWVTMNNPTTHKSLRCVTLSGLLPRLSPLTEDTSMITVSSCGVKLQEVLSSLGKKG